MFLFRQADLHEGASSACNQARMQLSPLLWWWRTVVQFSQLLLLSGHTVGTDQSSRQRPAGGLVRATVAVLSRQRRSDAPGDRPL